MKRFICGLLILLGLIVVAFSSPRRAKRLLQEKPGKTLEGIVDFSVNLLSQLKLKVQYWEK
jgi:hypothetical protein